MINAGEIDAFIDAFANRRDVPIDSTKWPTDEFYFLQIAEHVFSNPMSEANFELRHVLVGIFREFLRYDARTMKALLYIAEISQHSPVLHAYGVNSLAGICNYLRNSERPAIDPLMVQILRTVTEISKTPELRQSAINCLNALSSQ